MEQFNDSILRNLKNTVKQIQDAINPSIKQSVQSNDNVIKTLQTDDQMFMGVNATGLDIRPFYADSTKRIKLSKKPSQPIDRVTLKDTGKFYDSVQVEARDTEFEIKSPISYSVFLTDKYKDIFGLTTENLQFFTKNYVIPQLNKNIDDIIAKS